MEAKYKVGQKVDINRDNEILEVQIFGHFKMRERVLYSVRSEGKFHVIEESEILERVND
jgi:hypothetical protein